MSRKPYDFIDTKNAFAPEDSQDLVEFLRERRRVEQLFLSKLAQIIDYYFQQKRDPPA
ncbi:hypothetical protein ACFQWB_16850 [Paenibacillus thermoaerophilus]|uniref:Uncharacterized protein n=1 Tax=Paenibacillus thermoaerophilus TaxID=1215385 RepID=A0ABW2V919_9BACL|nr:hypothetical protein [Paenibacillus thermoaerophilus]